MGRGWVARAVLGHLSSARPGTMDSFQSPHAGPQLVKRSLIHYQAPGPSFITEPDRAGLAGNGCCPLWLLAAPAAADRSLLGSKVRPLQPLGTYLFSLSGLPEQGRGRTELHPPKEAQEEGQEPLCSRELGNAGCSRLWGCRSCARSGCDTASPRGLEPGLLPLAPLPEQSRRWELLLGCLELCRELWVWMGSQSCHLPEGRGCSCRDSEGEAGEGAGNWEGKCVEMVPEPLPAACAGSAGLGHLTGTITSCADPELFLLPGCAGGFAGSAWGPAAWLCSFPCLFPQTWAIPQGIGCSLASVPVLPTVVLFYPFFRCHSVGKCCPSCCGQERGLYPSDPPGKSPKPTGQIISSRQTPWEK